MQRKEKLIDKAGYESLSKQSYDNLYWSRFTAKSEETVLFPIAAKFTISLDKDFVSAPAGSEERL
jgi:hypothetical protein